MNIEKALSEFWSQFGKAYQNGLVPTKAILPYITYEVLYGDSFSQVLTFSTLYVENNASGIAKRKQMVEDLETIFTYGGVMLPYNNGFLWLNRTDNWIVFGKDSEEVNVLNLRITYTIDYLK